jgi:DNA helicase II / ATP-dependent DNA helicase PcrA
MSRTLADALDEETLRRSLNAPQFEAVMHAPGPQLILAGAGSGKTRVLTYKIAWLIQAHGFRSEEILAVTFTNKAAAEMRERVAKLLGFSARLRWMGTFHSICARLLRLHAVRLGYTGSFTIFDTDDQRKFLKKLLQAQRLEEDARFTEDKVRFWVSSMKNSGMMPEDAKREATDRFEERMAALYALYQEEMQKANAMDFDDLILLAIRLLKSFPEVRALYQAGFHYVLVDEYQDTNKAQYQLIKLLIGPHHNLVVVGDDDQSIYGWRGADIGNILSFKEDYPQAKVIKLEQNYRSSGHILGVAGSVIKNNRKRMPKRVFTENAAGDKPTLTEHEDDNLEAAWVARKIQSDVRYRAGETAVFYRTNAQSRVLEDELRRQRIPYLIVGGIRFYERKEVKDVLAYLRLLVNRRDSLSLMRIINVPKRSIGETSMQKVQDLAVLREIPLIDALQRADEADVGAKALSEMRKFVGLMRELRDLSQRLTLPELIAEVINRSGYRTFLEKEATDESQDRLNNIEELVAAAQDFMDRKSRGEIDMGDLADMANGAEIGQSAESEASVQLDLTAPDQGAPNAPNLARDLDLFLQEIALVADTDSLKQSQEAVTLMTVHSAKGLEFPRVFVTGLEDGLFPLLRDDDGDIEEERRLFYVAATRAEKDLHLSYARRRRRYGGFQDAIGSRFISEIDKNHYEMAGGRARPKPLFRDRHDDEHHHRHTEVAYEDISQEAEAEGGIRKGQKVMHARFGLGSVVQTEGHGEQMRVTVVFQDHIRRTLLAKFANLKLA